MKTIVFDFDGVIHSYKSGWQGPDIIADPVVPGIKEAIEEIRQAGYKVVVVSTRCATESGMAAIFAYLENNGIAVDDVVAEKPPAIAYIDDRAICFDGKADTLLGKVESFEPWYKKDETDRSSEERQKTNKCNYCDLPIYIKTVQYTKPLLAPLTEEQALRDRLLDLTGEVYVEMPKRFCPMCGKEIGGHNEQYRGI